MPENNRAAVAGGCAALIGAVAIYAALFIGFVWLIATVIHGVFF